jgi:sugar O-acyltransferase (sialic acid O-acetyltransferase NeuD family)
MIKPKMVLIGSGGHASSCIDVIEQEGNFSIAGLIGIETDLDKKSLEYDVIGTDNSLRALVKNIPYAFIGIGQSKGLEFRGNLFARIEAIGFKIPRVISPISYVSKHSSVGFGTVVMHGAQVNANAVVGSNCIVNSQSLIEHGVLVGNNCHISTGAIINGDVTIGPNTLVGSGAVIKEGVKIGSNVRIGMGVIVRKDIEDNSTYVGEIK